jgi:hypothetical protein
MTKLPFHLIYAAAIAIGSLGCGKGGQAAQDSKESGVVPETPVKGPASATPKVPLKPATNRKPNQDGAVFIAEYHHIREGKTTMERSPAAFRKDLERLYKLGFRPINVTEYLSGKFDLPPGATPVILTFDDAHPSQIRMLPNGELDPDCGFGILKQFSEKHPDFRPKAVFFVLPQMWGQPNFKETKAALIESSGGEVANHTMTHSNLSKISDAQVKNELAMPFEFLRPYRAKPEYLALPLGISPKDKSLLEKFEFRGHSIEFKAVFLVGASPAPSPTSDKFDPRRIPRIQACEGPYGLDFWLEKVEKGQVKLLVTP